jgi:cobyric acid synthase
LRWAGHVIRREHEKIIKGLMIVKLEGKRKKGRPRMRWMDGVEKDLKNLGVVNWRAKAQERDDWRKFIEQAKFHEGLQCQ